jgi:hypothetical protein
LLQTVTPDGFLYTNKSVEVVHGILGPVWSSGCHTLAVRLATDCWGFRLYGHSLTLKAALSPGAQRVVLHDPTLPELVTIPAQAGTQFRLQMDIDCLEARLRVNGSDLGLFCALRADIALPMRFIFNFLPPGGSFEVLQPS